MTLPPGETRYVVVKRLDGYRVLVSRGDVGPVPVTEIVGKVEALRVAQQLSDRQHDLYEAFQAARQERVA